MRLSVNTKHTMKFAHLLLFAAGVTLLASVRAQQALPAAADATAAVPPLQYESVFTDTAAPKAEPQSPDKTWVHANRTLLGDGRDAPATGDMPTADAPEKTFAPAPHHGQHDHKGTHQ
jgi:hypothetical protein